MVLGCAVWRDWEGYDIVSCIGFSCEIYGGQFISVWPGRNEDLESRREGGNSDS